MYNEANGIQTNVSKILKALEALPVSWEYILVDDGSTDASFAEAVQAFGDDPRCRIVHYPRNRGRGYALRQGFAAARGRYVITTESDLSWGPEIIAKLYDALQTSGSDMVIASVHLPGGGLENVPVLRRLLTVGGNVIMRRAFGGKLTMLSGMTRAYRREVIDSLYLEQNDKEIHLEIVAKAKDLGYSITEIPATIRWEPTETVGKRSTGLSMAKFIGPHLMMSLRQGSVRFLTWATLGTLAAGILLAMAGTFNKLFLLFHPMPYLVTYGLVLILMSIILAMFGLLSIQISFLHSSVVHLQSVMKRLSSENGENVNSLAQSRAIEQSPVTADSFKPTPSAVETFPANRMNANPGDRNSQ
jgi:glycosyltransferase involved in cell wall biosynthesis